MTTLGIDESWSHIDPTAIVGAGYQFVIRYFSTDPTKNLTAPEAAGLHAKGLSIGAIWETEAQRALIGSAGGIVDAQACIAQAHAVGYHQGSTLFINIGDWDVQESEVPNIRDYFSAFYGLCQQQGFTPGGYGTAYIIDLLAPSFPVAVWWENAIDDGGVSGANVSPNASLYQRVKPTTQLAGAFDEDVMVRPVALWGPVVIPAPAPPPPPPTPIPAPPSYPHFPGRLLELHDPYMQGDDVRVWQQRMSDRHWTITVDGIYGPQTETVCRDFQTQKSLTVDGIVGPQTWDAAWTTPITIP